MFSVIRPVMSLYDQDTFDKQFMKDLQKAKNSVIIESPFIRSVRIDHLLPTLARLRRRGVCIIINTRNPSEHDEAYAIQAENAVSELQSLGIKVLFTVKHHRKIVVIDEEVFYEGSLNVLSFYDSCEIMRRTVSVLEAKTLIKFIGLGRYLNESEKI